MLSFLARLRALACFALLFWGAWLNAAVGAPLEAPSVQKKTDLYRNPSLWDEHPRLIIATVATFLLQSLLIVSLVIQRSRWKRAENALRESEARFRMMADTAPVMVWMSGPDMLCNFFNKPWLEFTGRTMEQEMGNGWSEGVHTGDLQHCLETYASGFRARQPFTMEYRLRRANGEYRWVLDTGVPRYRPEGEFAGYIGSAIDITDRRQAEAALRESEQNMSLAAASADMAMWMWDIPRDEVWTTDNGREFLGCAKSEKISFEKFLT